MPKAVIVNYRKCTGCRICELACSIRNEGVVSAQLSRIRVYHFPPGRILTEPLPSGIAKGQRLTQAQLSQMLDEYYKLRGWNVQTGTPTKEKLRELELNF